MFEGLRIWRWIWWFVIIYEIGYVFYFFKVYFFIFKGELIMGFSRVLDRVVKGYW